MTQFAFSSAPPLAHNGLRRPLDPAWACLSLRDIPRGLFDGIRLPINIRRERPDGQGELLYGRALIVHVTYSALSSRSDCSYSLSSTIKELSGTRPIQIQK